MKPVTKICTVAAAALTILVFLQWYVQFMMNLGIPEYIYNTPIKVSGFFLVASVILTFVIAGKWLYKADRLISVLKLTILLSVIGIVAETIFQVIKLVWYEFELVDFIKRIAILSIYYISIAFLASFQIVTKRTERLWLYIIVFVIIANIMIRFVAPMF